MHQDSPVYFLSLSKSHKAIFSEEDSWLVAALSGMKVGAYNKNMTQSILEILQGHSRFQHIQRVCVAERLGISNQLRTICSATDRSITNTMEAGYSCFLNPQGSIFNISNQNMRLFKNAREVVSSFKEKGLPVQRSMGLIAAMGLEGGLCWGVFKNSMLQGLIFMNGSGVKWQDPTPVDYTIFALLSHITQQILYSVHQPSVVYFQHVKGKEDTCVGKKYDPQLLAALTLAELGIHLQTGLQVECTRDVPTTLINHGHIAHILGRLIPCVRNLPKKLVLSTILNNNHVQFVLPKEIGKFLNKSDDRFLLAKSDGESLGIGVTHDEGDLILEVPYDGPAICEYSTYQPVDAAE